MEYVSHVYKMKNIEPFNKVWLDCYNNLKLSLLLSVDKTLEIHGYENLYEYYKGKEVSGGGVEFNYITVEQKVCQYEQFSKIEEKDFVNQKDFNECIIHQLSKPLGFVLIRVDLHDWLEGSVSWKKFHWDHYSLLVEYDSEKQVVTAFDELQGQYVKFQVDINTLYGHLSHNSRFSQLRLITLKDEFELPVVDLEKCKYNAKRLIENIDKVYNSEFWKMNDNDFRARSHMEVNGVFLQRIEGRQDANQKLIENILDNQEYEDRHRLENIHEGFSLLSKKWQGIRMELFRVYFDDRNRLKLLNVLNESMREALLYERKLWEEFI